MTLLRLAAVSMLALCSVIPSAAWAQPSGAASAPAITRETRPELFQDEPPPLPGATGEGATQGSAEAPQSPTAFWLGMLIRTVLVLGAVLALAYLLLNKGLTRLMKLTGVQPGRHLALLERLPLGQKHSLFLVEADGRRFLVGTSEQGIALVSDFGDQGFAPVQKGEIAQATAMTTDKGTA